MKPATCICVSLKHTHVHRCSHVHGTCYVHTVPDEFSIENLTEHVGHTEPSNIFANFTLNWKTRWIFSSSSVLLTQSGILTVYFNCKCFSIYTRALDTRMSPTQTFLGIRYAFLSHERRIAWRAERTSAWEAIISLFKLKWRNLLINECLL